MSGSSLAVVPTKGDDANTAAQSPDPIIHHYDPDVAELEAARAEVEAEKGKTGAAAPTPPPPTEPEPKAPPAEAASPPPVPYARFVEQARELQRLRDAAAYHEGRAEALAQGRIPAAGEAPQAPATPPEWIEAQAIEDDWTSAWTDYENGAVTAAELASKQIQTMARMLKLHVGAGMSAVRQEVAQAVRGLQPQVGVVDRQVMAQHVARLEAEHPWSQALDEREAAMLTQMAQVEAQGFGKSFPAGPSGTMALQQRVAELASIYMPQWHPGEEPPVKQPQAGTAPAAPQPQQPASNGARPTRDDIAVAMRRQAALPPNSPSAHAGNSGPVTLDRVNTMTDAELEALPRADRARLLGIST